MLQEIVPTDQIGLTGEAGSSTLVRGRLSMNLPMPETSPSVEQKTPAVETSDDILNALPFAADTLDHPIARQALRKYRTYLRRTRHEMRSEDVQRVLQDLQEVKQKADRVGNAEAKDAVRIIRGDVLVRAGRAGQNIFEIYKTVIQQERAKHRKKAASDEEVLGDLTNELEMLAAQKRITEKEKADFVKDAESEVEKQKAGQGEEVVEEVIVDEEEPAATKPADSAETTEKKPKPEPKPKREAVPVRIAEATGQFYRDMVDLTLRPGTVKEKKEEIDLITDELEEHMKTPYRKGVVRAQEAVAENQATLEEHKGQETEFLLTSMVQAKLNKTKPGEETTQTTQEAYQKQQASKAERAKGIVESLAGHVRYVEPTPGVAIVLIDEAGMKLLKDAKMLGEHAQGLFYGFEIGGKYTQFVIAQAADEVVQEASDEELRVSSTVKHETHHFIWSILEDKGFARVPKAKTNEETQAFTHFRHEIGARIVGEEPAFLEGAHPAELVYSDNPELQRAAVEMRNFITACIKAGHDQGLDMYTFLHPVLTARNFAELRKNLLELTPDIQDEALNEILERIQVVVGVEAVESAVKNEEVEEVKEVREYAVTLTPALLGNDEHLGGPTGDPETDPIRQDIINALNGRDVELLAQRPYFMPGGGLDTLWNNIQTDRQNFQDKIDSGTHTPAEVAEYQQRIRTVDRYLDVLNNLQMEAIWRGITPDGDPLPPEDHPVILARQLEHVITRPEVANMLLQRGANLDPQVLRHLLGIIDKIDVDSSDFKTPVIQFTRLKLGDEISWEAKMFLLEFLAEKFLNKMDDLPDVAWAMPVGLYVGGNYEFIEQEARLQFGDRGGEAKEYITRLKDQRGKMHEMYRSIPNQDQYKQIILSEIGDVGLDFVQNDIAGVNDVFALYEELGLNIAAMVAHRDHRILNDEEFKLINKRVEDHAMDLYRQGILRARSGRRLTEKEALRAIAVGREVAGGLQRTALAMGLGGSPAHSSQIYRPAAHAGIQKAMYVAKFAETGLMGHPPARTLMDGACTIAVKGMDLAYRAAVKGKKALKTRYVDGVMGISRRVAWLNTLSAPDILTNPSRSGAMALADVWIRREVSPGVFETTTLLNIVHEIGAYHKAKYAFAHGKPYRDGPNGFITNTDVAGYIAPPEPGKDPTYYRDFALQAVKQRLYVSYLAQYDAMPTDIKKLLFDKIAILKPQDMVSFYPELLDHAMRETGHGEAVWQSLHKKLVTNSRKRIIEEGRQMMAYNEVLKKIHTDPRFQGREAPARLYYSTTETAILNDHAHGVIIDAVRDQRLAELNNELNFPAMDAWQAVIDADGVVANRVASGGPTATYTAAERYALINHADYLGGTDVHGDPILNAQEEALLKKIIDTSLDGGIPERRTLVQHAIGRRPVSEQVTSIVSEAKMAYKMCLNDMPHVAWKSTGEGGGGLGRGSILTMYEDQAAVKEAVSKHLSHLMLSPIEHADDNIVGTVQLFGVHYGLPDAQDMIEPIIEMYVTMLRENFASRWFGKFWREKARMPNSTMEKLFAAKGFAFDELAIRNFLEKIANRDGIAAEKENYLDNFKELAVEWREHRFDGYGRWDTFKEIVPKIPGAFVKGPKASKLEVLLHKVGADWKGMFNKWKRHFLQLLFSWLPPSILKAILPEQITKPAGI